MPPESKVERYRKRAQELRQIATDLTNETARPELDLVAKQYDKLANDIERVEKTDEAQ